MTYRWHIEVEACVTIRYPSSGIVILQEIVAFGLVERSRLPQEFVEFRRWHRLYGEPFSAGSGLRYISEVWPILQLIGLDRPALMQVSRHHAETESAILRRRGYRVEFIAGTLASPPYNAPIVYNDPTDGHTVSRDDQVILVWPHSPGR